MTKFFKPSWMHLNQMRLNKLKKEKESIAITNSVQDFELLLLKIKNKNNSTFVEKKSNNQSQRLLWHKKNNKYKTVPASVKNTLINYSFSKKAAILTNYNPSTNNIHNLDKYSDNNFKLLASPAIKQLMYSNSNSNIFNSRPWAQTSVNVPLEVSIKERLTNDSTIIEKNENEKLIPKLTTGYNMNLSFGNRLNITYLLESFFLSLYCLISKPIFKITPDKIKISLFFYSAFNSISSKNMRIKKSLGLGINGAWLPPIPKKKEKKLNK